MLTLPLAQADRAHMRFHVNKSTSTSGQETIFIKACAATKGDEAYMIRCTACHDGRRAASIETISCGNCTRRPDTIDSDWSLDTSLDL